VQDQEGAQFFPCLRMNRSCRAAWRGFQQFIKCSRNDTVVPDILIDTDSGKKTPIVQTQPAPGSVFSITKVNASVISLPPHYQSHPQRSSFEPFESEYTTGRFEAHRNRRPDNHECHGSTDLQSGSN